MVDTFLQRWHPIRVELSENRHHNFDPWQLTSFTTLAPVLFFLRDENGFKCHTMSESHQRQLLIFAETPDKFLDTYSKDFEEGFLNTLKSTYGTKRTLANTVSRQHQDF
jgi:hypothetical protein